MTTDPVQQIRVFNRAVTRRLGVLSDDFLGRGRPLAESRLLFEIGREGADVRDLRARLALDSGYLSRLLRALEADGLVRCDASPNDARVRRVTLTRKGSKEFSALDDRSRHFATSMLNALNPAQQAGLVDAMAKVERFMRAAAVVIQPDDPASSAALDCVKAYLNELNERFDTGFDATRGPSADPQELSPPTGLFVLAKLDGEAVGCGGLKQTSSGVGEIKRMWVAPSARGLGIAQRMLEMLERHAVGMKLHTLQLDTNSTLIEARSLYLHNGYREIPAYNDNPYAQHWFEKSGLVER